jgi:hypothetical protein
MSKKTINVLLSILLSMPLIAGRFASSDSGNPLLSFLEICSRDNYAKVSYQKPCDMDHCNPRMPNCPLCPSSNSINPSLCQEGEAYLPPLTSSDILVSAETLFDQGVMRSVFRPPKSIL